MRPMTLSDGRRLPVDKIFSMPVGCRDTLMRRIFPITVLFLALYVAGCNLFQKAEIVRIQNQRSSANKYAAGDWMERRDAVREIVNYLGKEKNDLIIARLWGAPLASPPRVAT